jgi:hypothetical protein
MSDGGDSRAAEPYELFRHDQATWIIRATALPESDPRHIVAVITDAHAEGVHVAWAHPTSRPTRYFTADAVLQDLAQGSRPQSGSTRPVPIPHLPPRKRR